MPTTLTFPLHPEEADALPPYPGRALHALFYQWLALGDYSLSTRVHDQSGLHSFTVSLLHRVNGQPAIRFTLLDDDLWPALSKGIFLTSTVEVLNQPLTLPTGGPDVHHRSYADLTTKDQTSTQILLYFLSPTSFRSHGMHYPLPDPTTAYQSWLNRWNEFAPEGARINIALIDGDLLVIVVPPSLPFGLSLEDDDRRLCTVKDVAYCRSGSRSMEADKKHYFATGELRPLEYHK